MKISIWRVIFKLNFETTLETCYFISRQNNVRNFSLKEERTDSSLEKQSNLYGNKKDKRKKFIKIILEQQIYIEKHVLQQITKCFISNIGE